MIRLHHSTETREGNLNWRTSRLVGFDVETTGLDPVADRIIQIAITAYDPNEDTFGPELTFRCGSDGVESQEDAISVHGIRPEEIADLPSFDSTLERVQTFLLDFADGPMVYVGFNAPFDMAFLFQSFGRREIPCPIDPYRVLDPLAFARSIWPYNRLPELAARLAVPIGPAHDACTDVRMALQILVKLGLERDLPVDLDEALKLQEKHIQEWEKRTSRRYREALLRVGPAPATKAVAMVVDESRGAVDAPFVDVQVKALSARGGRRVNRPWVRRRNPL